MVRTTTAKLLVLTAAVAFMAMTATTSFGGRDDGPDHWTAEQWVAWRDSQIKLILTPSASANGVKTLSRNAVVLRSVAAYRFLAPFLAKSGLLATDPHLTNRFHNFVEFVKTQAAMAQYDDGGIYTHKLGYAVSDLEYWQRSAAELQIPPLLRSAEFLKYLANPATYKAAVDLIEAQNRNLPEGEKWLVLNYRSRFLKSPDAATYGRMLILAPNTPARDGGSIDRWIQFAIELPDATLQADARAEIKSVSVVAIHRDGGAARATMSDFMRQTDRITGRIKIDPAMLIDQKVSKNCYDCHKSPVLPIHAKALFGFDAAGRLSALPIAESRIADVLNAKIEEYGKCEISFMNAAAYGPTIGSSVSSTRDGLLRTEKALSRASTDRIRSAMDCAKCHDAFARINYPQAVQGNIAAVSFEEKKDLVQTYIEQGWMPPHNDLSHEERAALWRCLTKEYYDPENATGLLVDWLKGN
jgi:hypothetical protein